MQHLLYLTILFISISVNCFTILPQNINSNYIMTEQNSPYVVNGVVTIQEGIMFTGNNVSIIFNSSDAEINSKGIIDWNYCTITSKPESNSGTLNLITTPTPSRTTLSSCLFHGLNSAIIIITNSNMKLPLLSINECLFKDCGTAIYTSTMSSMNTANKSSASVANSTFINNLVSIDSTIPFNIVNNTFLNNNVAVTNGKHVIAGCDFVSNQFAVKQANVVIDCRFDNNHHAISAKFVQSSTVINSEIAIQNSEYNDDELEIDIVNVVVENCTLAIQHISSANKALNLNLVRSAFYRNRKVFDVSTATDIGISVSNSSFIENNIVIEDDLAIISFVACTFEANYIAISGQLHSTYNSVFISNIIAFRGSSASNCVFENNIQSFIGYKIQNSTISHSSVAISAIKDNILFPAAIQATNNIIRSCSIAFAIGDVISVVNNTVENSTVLVKLETTIDIEIPNNNWGSNNCTQIKEQMIDNHNDKLLGTILFVPFKLNITNGPIVLCGNKPLNNSNATAPTVWNSSKPISGVFTGDLILSLLYSPFIIEQVVMLNNTSIIIHPGVDVSFAKANGRSVLLIYTGSLIANGKPLNQISINGTYGTIVARNSAKVELSYCTVSNLQQPITSLYVDNVNANNQFIINNCYFSSNKQVFATSGTVSGTRTISYSTFTNNEVVISLGCFTISASSFKNNRIAILDSDGKVSNCVFSSNVLALKSNSVHACSFFNNENALIITTNTATVTNSTFNNNNIAIKVKSPKLTTYNNHNSISNTINFNNIIAQPSNKFSVQLQTKQNIDMSNNYWGTTNTTEIYNTILDQRQQSSLGIVNVLPILASPVQPQVPCL